MSRRMSLAVGVLTVGLLASACSSNAQGPMQADWPEDIRSAPVVVRRAYAFAHEHPEVLSSIPCYCGCGVLGHTSNYACYIAGEDLDGNLVYDPHALACSICVDITLDASRLTEDGRSTAEIRSYIDSTYSRYGPSNMP
ncbi:MAG TPA: PCYCGC motif-containing (lipo)protein [Anaerolineales bacterium]|nr:PCYCGC motif-containing (lipo)protein [Anaerolineales bacterium]